MNFKKLRQDFPIFGRKGVPKELVYLDSAATAQKPQAVIDRVIDFYTNHNANVYRGLHDGSEHATKMYEETRAKVAEFIGAQDPAEVIFTSGATAGINMVAYGWAKKHLKAGDEIVITEAEHHANFLPWQLLAKDLGLTIRYIPIDKKHFVAGAVVPLPAHEQELIDMGMMPESDEIKIDRSYLTEIITDKTKLVAISADSNVLGPIWDDTVDELGQVIKRAKEVGAKVLLDASQLVPHERISLSELNADFLVFAPHKMFAPTGVGVLYIKKALHEQMEPYVLGGMMVNHADVSGSQWKESPYKFEAGTPPISGVLGLGAAVDYLKNINFDELKTYEAQLVTKLVDGLLSLDGVAILGDVGRLKRRGHLVSFIVDGIHPHDIASFLDMRGVAVRAGHHCAQPLATALGIESSVRVSFALYNTPQEIDTFLDALKDAIAYLRK